MHFETNQAINCWSLIKDHVADDQPLAGTVVGGARQQRVSGVVLGIVAAGEVGRRRYDALVPAAITAAGKLHVGAGFGIDAGQVSGVARS